MSQKGFAEMSQAMFKDHCEAKIANFEDAKIPKDSKIEKIMHKVKKVQKTPEMPNFEVEDKDFKKHGTYREGELIDHTKVDP